MIIQNKFLKLIQYAFYVLLVMCINFSNTSAFEAVNLTDSCDKNAIKSQSVKLNSVQEKAEKSVMKLKEFESLSANFGVNQRALFETNFAQKEISKKQECFMQVVVYVDWKDEKRRTLWHTYLVDLDGRVKFVLDSEGEFVKLKQYYRQRNKNNEG